MEVQLVGKLILSPLRLPVPPSRLYKINPHNKRLAQTSAATFADTHHTNESSTQPNTSGLIVLQYRIALAP
jgi:hypothetical protein